MTAGAVVTSSGEGEVWVVNGGWRRTWQRAGEHRLLRGLLHLVDVVQVRVLPPPRHAPAGDRQEVMSQRATTIGLYRKMGGAPG